MTGREFVIGCYWAEPKSRPRHGCFVLTPTGAKLAMSGTGREPSHAGARVTAVGKKFRKNLFRVFTDMVQLSRQSTQQGSARDDESFLHPA
jgi:hypothetical protein